MTKLRKTYLKMCAAITVSALLSNKAMADETIGDAANKITASLKEIPKLIEIITYIAGLAFGIAGLIKLKEYMDKAGQGGIKEPMGRLLIGAFLVTLPTVLKVITASSIGDDGEISLSSVSIEG